MEETMALLIESGIAHPLMQPSDAIKFLYQGEFGAGHLIADEEAAYRYLCEEYDCVTQTRTMVFTEDLGNGMARLYLDGISRDALRRVHMLFVKGAYEVQGDQKRFLEKIAELHRITREGKLPFSIEELESVWKTYEANGCPPARHSEIYRAAYAPAYRVVKKDDCLLEYF